MSNCGRSCGLARTFAFSASTSSGKDELINCSSTRSRMLSAAYANSALRPNPNSVNETIRRKRSLRLDRIRIDHAISDTVTRVDQRFFEGFVDRRAETVDMHAQRVRIGQFLAPDALFQILAGDHRGTGFHQRLQRLEAGGVRLGGLAFGGGRAG